MKASKVWSELTETEQKLILDSIGYRIDFNKQVFELATKVSVLLGQLTMRKARVEQKRVTRNGRVITVCQINCNHPYHGVCESIVKCFAQY